MSVVDPARMAATHPPPRLSLNAEKRNLYPWIFRKMVVRPAPDDGIHDGDAVAVYDRHGRFIGRGFYNPRSQVAVRILDFSSSTESEPLEEAFLRDRIARAVRIRHDVLGLPEVTDAYRVVNSEGDHLSGLIVDLYADRASVELHSLGFYRRRAAIERCLRAHFALAKEDGVVFRADARIQDIEGFRIDPPRRPVTAVIRENGVRFRVDLVAGHKTGFFLDQRDNRAALAPLCAGKRVLDVCCYTGGFALHAKVRGGARDVVGIDLDEKAVAVAVENARLNGLKPGRDGIAFAHDNAFHFLKQPREAGDLFDVAVVDPSKLAPSREALEKALRDYLDLNRLAMRNLRSPGLLLTCSCSGLVSIERFLEVLARAGGEAGREVRVLRISGPGADHPVVADFPEGLYLKVVLAEIRER